MVLRTISSDGTQTNQKLGDYYQLIKKNQEGDEKHPRFEDCLKIVYEGSAEAWRNEVYGFVTNGETVEPLFNEKRHFMLMDNGEMFDDLRPLK